jgi:hypothetical protein
MTCRRRPPIPRRRKPQRDGARYGPTPAGRWGLDPSAPHQGSPSPHLDPRSRRPRPRRRAGLRFQGPAPPHRSGVRGRPALCPARKRPPGSRRHGGRRRRLAGQQARGMNRRIAPNGSRFTHRSQRPSRGVRSGVGSRSGRRLETALRTPDPKGMGDSDGPKWVTAVRVPNTATGIARIAADADDRERHGPAQSACFTPGGPGGERAGKQGRDAADDFSGPGRAR